MPNTFSGVGSLLGVGTLSTIATVYTIGDTGPGGGKVFYVAPTTFISGPTLNLTCKYLEAAPTTGTNAWTDDAYAWSETQSTAIGANAQGTAIGTGYKNTLAMVTQSATAGYAGTASRTYGGPNSLTDWFLPSKDELYELYTNRASVPNLALSSFYWSSSEYDSVSAWTHRFLNGSQYDSNKDSPYQVRPVRAF